MAQHPTFEISANQIPTQGSKALPLPFNFSASDRQEGDLLQEIENGFIDFVQAVYIDNSANDAAFMLTFPGMGKMGFPLIAPPNSQGFYSVTVPVGITSYIAETDQADIDVLVILYNCCMAPNVWFVTGGGGGSNGVQTGTTTDVSGTAGVASAPLFAANADAIRRIVQNPPNSTNSIWVQSGAAATADFHSQEIQPGQQFDTATGPIDPGAMFVISDAAGIDYLAWEIAK